MSVATDAPVLDLDCEHLFTVEELRWRDRVREFTAKHITPVVDADFEDRHFRLELVRGLGELGVLGMHLEGHGCAGAGAVSYGLACMELEAGDTAWRTFVSVQGSLAMTAIAKWGSDEQQRRWLPGMAAGRTIGCFALTEPDGGSDPAGMRTVARREGGDWVLNGAKRWIGLGSVADVAVVWAATEEGVRGFVVPTDTPGFVPRDITNKLSLRASIQCDLSFEDCRVPADAVLPGVIGLRGPFSCLNEARYGIVWGVMGAARECLRAAVERSTSRRVFGRPLAEFQLTQQKLADMAVEYQKGLLLALHLGRLKEDGRLAPAQISVGKLNNVREALDIARTVRTILGGDGVTSDFPVMRHMANLESVRTYEGTDEVHALVIGQALTGHRAFS
ncbi:acyl-CoA dehydrogenase family protein [Streptomyces sp. NL15-2K]|uniref:acyl-CoA dehydrogenase family protein n=1 Tax=Streptomyces sp. NL15-2K TaxID=376149 RepID=UPI000F582E89|nr:MULTISPECIES: acyl-CoA dehydrogenase family protein [Actinomycetes]WKX15217.1 acyl-CoA dehydrogenase family protein [Kutzneria buriramensis]GCB52333.1 glutaryl-CoA dehydrogenase [Streptomyces sp. NL15-2K]